MTTKEISLKLLVHKEKNQVVYAESGQDFVDVLFSFLTMPIGTIVRLLGKQSKIGCMSMLYESMEDLDMRLLQNKACKNMLLHPKSSSEEHCKNLTVNIDDTKPTQYYTCSNTCIMTHKLISTSENARCCCGRVTSKNIPRMNSDVVGNENEGVFVNGNMRFMITDDLEILPISMTTCLEMFKKLGISDAIVLEERNAKVAAAEVLQLLKRLLLSKTPLTDVFLVEDDMIGGTDLDLKAMNLDSKDMDQCQSGKEIGSDSRKMSVKLYLGKSDNKVLFAEAGEEFTDLLFSFLAFPLGSIVKFLGGCTRMGCLDNLYKSVEELSNKDCMKSEECKAMLLDPKLAPYFGSKNQLLHIEEKVWQPTIADCTICNYYRLSIREDGHDTCSHGIKCIQLITMNPKYSDAVTELGGAFIAGPDKFMVTDELNVKLLSPISGISLLNKYNIPISDLEERIVSMGEEEALSLLKASLVSKTVLSDVFCPKKPKQVGMGSYKRLVASARNVKPEI